MKIKELRKESYEIARKLEDDYLKLPPEEKYKGYEFRKEQCTVSDIVRMVREGQPINGIQRSFGVDDDEEGADDGRTDDDERAIHEKVMEGKEYYDDELIFLNTLSEKERQKYYEEHQPQPRPEGQSQPQSEAQPEAQSEDQPQPQPE